MSQTHSNSPAPNSNNPHLPTEGWDGKEQKVPMNTREVATPGNRPGLFLTVPGKVAKQPDFYDPYFPLRYLEVPKCA